MSSAASSLIRILLFVAAILSLVACQFGPRVPPGGQTWVVTVVNRSPRPANLFVAEDGPNGMGGLVGAVTPNVVPPGTTVDVSFVLPPGHAWGIFVNPLPDTGPLLTSADLPLATRIVIEADGGAGWTSGG